LYLASWRFVIAVSFKGQKSRKRALLYLSGRTGRSTGTGYKRRRSHGCVSNEKGLRIERVRKPTSGAF
jgi:hypothetical protein